jgi:hypothetical protein
MKVVPKEREEIRKKRWGNKEHRRRGRRPSEAQRGVERSRRSRRVFMSIRKNEVPR